MDAKRFEKVLVVHVFGVASGAKRGYKSCLERRSASVRLSFRLGVVSAVTFVMSSSDARPWAML